MTQRNLAQINLQMKLKRSHHFGNVQRASSAIFGVRSNQLPKRIYLLQLHGSLVKSSDLQETTSFFAVRKDEVFSVRNAR